MDGNGSHREGGPSAKVGSANAGASVGVNAGVRILGVDPGLQITGYGVLSVSPTGCTVVEAGVVRAAARGSLASRVRTIHDGICDVIASLKPSVLALEELYSHYQRPRTAILMGHARGVICLAAALNDLTVAGYSATQVKKILTGSGRAPKPQMQQAIQRELGLAQLPQPADVADALAIALCHYYLKQRAAAVRATRTGLPDGRPVPRH